tara:strand:- start:272 stop:862 length:591 start_codon:yes stop_codon:yes gene_type:complete
MCVIKNYFKYIRYSLFILIIISCTNNTSINNDANQIISLVINELSQIYQKPLVLNKEIEKEPLAKELIFVLERNMNLISKNLVLKKNNQEYQELLNNLSNLKFKNDINIKEIGVIKGIKILKLTDEHIEIIKSGKSHNSFDVFLLFSMISFNDNNDKALLIVNHGTSSLASSMDIFFLKKKNNIWKILNTQNISIS